MKQYDQQQKKKSVLEKTQELLTVDIDTVCYVLKYLWIASYFYSHSKVQYVSPLIFNEPRIPGNESKKGRLYKCVFKDDSGN